MSLQTIADPLLPIVRLGLTLDEAGHFLPTFFYRREFRLTGLPSRSAASIAKMKEDDSGHDYVMAQVLDPPGRVVQQTMAMVVQQTEYMQESMKPGTPKHFYPDLPGTRAKTLRLTGRLPEMTSTFDLSELAKMESK